jgi:hypothetical protein
MRKILLPVLLLTCASFYVTADVPQNQRKEVRHLLEFVKTSACFVSRNGSKHNGKSAAKHMGKKYKHFRDDIKTTEDFIRLSATKSTMSGKLYKVTCPGQTTINTHDWLLSELKAFRSKR